MSIKAVNQAIDQVYYAKLALKNLLRGLEPGLKDYFMVVDQIAYLECAHSDLRELSKRMVDEAYKKWKGPAASEGSEGSDTPVAPVSAPKPSCSGLYYPDEE